MNLPAPRSRIDREKQGSNFRVEPTTHTITIPPFHPAADHFDIRQDLFNSTVATAIGALLPLLLSFPAAYATARRGYGWHWLLPIIPNLRVLPLVIFALPLYMMYQSARLLDTRLGLGLILAIAKVPLTYVLLVNAIAEVPIELEESARIDGARTVNVLVRNHHGDHPRSLLWLRNNCRVMFVSAFGYSSSTPDGLLKIWKRRCSVFKRRNPAV